MDPLHITTSDWYAIGAATTSLARFAGLVIAGALTFLISHALLPSLVYTHHLSPRAHSVRPVLYVVAVAAFALAVLSFVEALSNAIAVISRIYPRWFI